MLITDKSFTAQEFKDKVMELAQQMSNRIPGAKVELKQDNMMQMGYNCLILNVFNNQQYGCWSITHSNSTGKVSCIRVLNF